jgi:putative zinc finger protein
MVTTPFLSILNTLDVLVEQARDSEPGARSCVTHLPFGRLVDYVRGLGTAIEREQVRLHLFSCPPCERSASRLMRLAEIACAEMDCSAPDEVVEDAIALFTSEPSSRQAVSDISRLVVDSSRRSAYGGGFVPGDRGRLRFLRFEAEGGEIDVHLLVIEESVGVSVAGQISARMTDRALDAEVSVHRKAGQPPIAHTRANISGLFQLRYDAPASVLLHFVFAGVPNPIDVPIGFDLATENR